MMALLVLATVVRIVDGDLLDLRENGQVLSVRVIGMDCFASSHYGTCREKGDGLRSPEAKVEGVHRAGSQLLPFGSIVKVQRPSKGPTLDSGGRTLAYLSRADGSDYGLQMMTEGFCTDASWKYPHERWDAYRVALTPQRSTFDFNEDFSKQQPSP